VQLGSSSQQLLASFSSMVAQLLCLDAHLFSSQEHQLLARFQVGTGAGGACHELV
jgi:hypothetical protein